MANFMSNGAFLFGATAFISIFGYYDDRTTVALLVALWLGFALLRPVELLIHFALRLSGLVARRSPSIPIGTVRRVDHPNIVRAALTRADGWRKDRTFAACLPGGSTSFVIPLFDRAPSWRPGARLVHRDLHC
jgi:hypothetical protein